MNASITSRELVGWRAGRPEEDPEKMKRWGFVTAKPSEHLIHVRGGKVTDKSGQGATCFKWPWDSVAIVPTSLQQLSFRADQVSAEKVGVEVVGLAVYRIAEPELAFRVLNFSYPERAQQKLEETLTSMFVGATRRIVATLGVEDCMRKRKAALAEELLREIAPVVGGEGRPDDFTTRGWGVVIDTIEIQEVRVQSQSVFAAMQAPYRAELEQRARVAAAHAEQAIAEGEAACRRDAEMARLRADDELSAERAAAEQRAGEREALLMRGRSEAQAQQRIRQAELRALEAEAERDAVPARIESAKQQAELDRLVAVLEVELRSLRAEIDREESRARVEIALADANVHRVVSDADAALTLAQKLPELAQAIGQRMGPVHVTAVGADANPMAHVAASIGALLELARGVKSQ